MAGKFTGLQRTYQVGDADGVPMYTAVTYGSEEGSVIKPTADNAVPVGVVCNDERIDDPLRAGGDQTGRDVAVQVSGYCEVKLSGEVSYGDPVILATGGAVKALPVGAGTYFVLGFTEKAGVDGDVVPVKMSLHVQTV